MSRRHSVLMLVTLGLALSLPQATRAAREATPALPASSAELPAPWTGAMHAQDEASVPDPGYIEDQLLVRFQPGTSAERKRELHEQHGAQVIREIPEIGVEVLQLYDNAITMVYAYQAESEVRFAEPNYLAAIPEGADTPGGGGGGLLAAPGPRTGARPAADGPLDLDLIPNDPHYGTQWHHARIDSPRAWDYSRGAGVTVAIVDTGVNCAHADLAADCVAGYDFANNDSDPTDDHGHGTHVAGTAAAATNNAVGVAGTGYDAKIMPLKALGASGNGSHAAIAAGITWAADHGADVINLSLGGFFTSSTLRNAVEYAVDRDVVVVAAAGNDNTSNPTYPAAFPNVIGVSATTQADTKASFSNYGQYVDVAAPGVGILATARNGGFVSMSGTSMASPVAAGLAALLRAQDATRTAAQVEQLMESSADDLGSPGWDALFGHGRINAGAALQAGAGGGVPGPATPTSPPPTVPNPTATPTPAGDFIQQVEDLINAERAAVGLPPLVTNGLLRLAADRHVSDMASGRFCSHGGSDGSSPYDRMRDTGYNWPYGEIIACGYTSPAAVVEAWMSSTAGHREIILCTSCTELGAGYRSGSQGYVHYWTVNFGSGPVSLPTPTVAPSPTPGPTDTPPPPTAVPTGAPPTATPLPGSQEVCLHPAADRAGWVVSTQANQNNFDSADTYTGTWFGRVYHGAMQFDLDPVPSDAFINFARLELTGRSGDFLGDSGTWSVHLLDTAIDAGFANHGYAQIHNAVVESTLLPLLGVSDLGTGKTNVFNLTSSQLAALTSRLTGSRRVSFRTDGPTGGSQSNVFTWDTGQGADSQQPAPCLLVNYSTGATPPVPTPADTDTPLPAPTGTVPPTSTSGPTAVPPTNTATAPPPPPTTTPSPTVPPPPTEDPRAGEVELIPAQGDVGWVSQNRSGNKLGSPNTYSGYYHGYIYHGAAQFDLSPIPVGAPILSARLTLTGQSTRWLSSQGNGRWRIRLLEPSVDAGWRSHSYHGISGADILSTLHPSLNQADLDVGRRNTFVFDEAQRAALEARVNGTRKVSFRFDGPRTGISNVFDWDSGYGPGIRQPPVLAVTFGAPGGGEPTPLPTATPDPADLISTVIERINAERVRLGLNELVISDALMRAAAAHNTDMADNNFFSHIGSDGSTVAQRIQREGFQAGEVGEILSMNSADIDLVMQAWLARSQQFEIRDPDYTHIGAHYHPAPNATYPHRWTVKFAEAQP